MDKPHPLIAAGFMLAATAFIAGTTLLAKMAGAGEDGLNPLQISQGRFLFAFLGFWSAAAVLRPKFTKPNMKVHLIRTLAGWGGVTGMFAAVQFIPLSDATAITFTNPVFAMLLAIAFLGERAGPWRWLAAGLAFTGALVLIRPGPGTFQPGALIALGAAAIMGTEIVILKAMTGREKPFQILLINNSLGLVIATLAGLFVWQWPSPRQWVLLAALGLMMAGAQSLYIQALRRAEASFVMPFSYATLIWATAYDLGVFGVVPDRLSLLGAAIILLGGFLLAWREGRRV
ncbi:MAG TPA: DMT family transporter [Rhodobacterales bacterium]|nr:DMT family transporter [Rhodobacterales bacterium]